MRSAFGGGSLLAISLLSWGCESKPNKGHVTSHQKPPEQEVLKKKHEPEREKARQVSMGETLRSPSATSCPKSIELPQVFRVEAPSLTEISGAVSSQNSPGVLWVHNDSGDEGNAYALDSQGHLVGTVRLSGAAIDWEDIARYRSPQGVNYLYVADTGDNMAARRDGVSIHRFAEPTLADLKASHPKPLLIAPESSKVTFPEGPRDVEALLVDPRSGELVLISKPPLDAPGVYSGQFEPHFEAKLRGTITSQSAGHPVALVTAADISPDGRFILLRTYTQVFLFTRDPAEAVSDALLGPACSYPGPAETQGEAVAFMVDAYPDSRDSPPAYVTVSEGLKPALFRFSFLKN